MFAGPGVARSQRLSTAEAARELGVSPATVKRWADGGLLRAIRTAGGHRRFDQAELARFSKVLFTDRDALSTWVQTLLDDPDRALDAALHVERDRLGAWYRVAEAVLPVVQDLEAGRAVPGAGPGAHAAADRLSRALARCSGALDPRSDAPRAILATPEVDSPAIELSLMELCMRERGWKAIWRGGAARAEEIAAAVDRGEAEAVALSATVRCPSQILQRDLEVLVPPCQRRGVALVIGGDAPWPDAVPYGRRERTFSGLHAWMVEYEHAVGVAGESLAR